MSVSTRDPAALATVTVTARAAAEAEAAFHRAIREAHAAGWSMRELGAHLGVSPATIHRFVHAGDG